jgi:hypothetical protein
MKPHSGPEFKDQVWPTTENWMEIVLEPRANPGMLASPLTMIYV